jgi:hypothetical protein
MRDGSIKLLSLIISEPNWPLKFYVEMSGLSRATFYKNKRDLENLGIIRCKRSPNRVVADTDKAISFLLTNYPGIGLLLRNHGNDHLDQRPDPVSEPEPD